MIKPKSAKPVFARMEHRAMKVVNSLGPMPAAHNFVEGEEVLVRFKSGKHAIGRVMTFAVGYPAAKNHKHVFFSTGRGTKSRILEEAK